MKNYLFAMFASAAVSLAHGQLLDQLGKSLSTVGGSGSSISSNQYYQKGRELAMSGDWNGAYSMFKSAAELGNPKAQFQLGRMADNMFGSVHRMVPPPWTQENRHIIAAQWWAKAANQGHAKATAWLGTAYRDGRGVPADPAMARKLFLEASKRGDPDGLAQIGGMYQEGIGVAKDNVEAFKYYLLAAEAGDGMAMYSVERMYDEGVGVIQNRTEANKWKARARTASDAKARQESHPSYFYE